MARGNGRIQLICIETLRLDSSGVPRLESAFALSRIRALPLLPIETTGFVVACAAEFRARSTATMRTRECLFS